MPNKQATSTTKEKKKKEILVLGGIFQVIRQIPRSRSMICKI